MPSGQRRRALVRNGPPTPEDEYVVPDLQLRQLWEEERVRRLRENEEEEARRRRPRSPRRGLFEVLFGRSPQRPNTTATTQRSRVPSPTAPSPLPSPTAPPAPSDYRSRQRASSSPRSRPRVNSTRPFIVKQKNYKATNRKTRSPPRRTSSSKKECKPECPVCLEQVRLPVVPKCGHLFCKGCIEHQTVCPLCRKPVGEVRRVYGL